jgi:putative membrane protein
MATLAWSRGAFVWSGLWAMTATALHEGLGWEWLAVPWIPMSALAVAVAFYLGFKNNASYDRLWEARKIWGGIVNVSRSWAYGVRDLVSADFQGHAAGEASELSAVRRRLVTRHVAWLDALRHQLRRRQTWEHQSDAFSRLREQQGVPELHEELLPLLCRHVGDSEAHQVAARINPAAHFVARQSADLAGLRQRRWLDGFSHVKLQGLLDEMTALQGKAERIKNFPFPRQYATVNAIFARVFTFLIPLGFLEAFADQGWYGWMTIPFATLVSWVFLVTDQIGDWSENPFEGLSNDVPISTLSRAIERDILEILGEEELPPVRPLTGLVAY